LRSNAATTAMAREEILMAFSTPISSMLAS
jgi:hypothetical protein